MDDFQSLFIPRYDDEHNDENRSSINENIEKLIESAKKRAKIRKESNECNDDLMHIQSTSDHKKRKNKIKDEEKESKKKQKKNHHKNEDEKNITFDDDKNNHNEDGIRLKQHEKTNDETQDDQSMDEEMNQEKEENREKKKNRKNQEEDQEEGENREEEENQEEGEENQEEGENQEEEENQEEGENQEDDLTVNTNDFQIIGEIKRLKKMKVKPVLPEWINNNAIVFGSDMKNCGADLSQFSHLINESLVSKMRKNSINHLFPVQAKVIPFLLNCFQSAKFFRPHDVCVSSPTGSGKTLAFVIPIVQHLLKRVVSAIRVLVVLPVRDLALQVHSVFAEYTRGTSLKVGLIIGQKSFTDEYNELIRKSVVGHKHHSLVDILVATPGKLVDFIQRAPGFSLRHLEILVLDEADRMMNETQFNWFQEIEKCVYGNINNSKIPCACFINNDVENNVEKNSVENRFCIDCRCGCFLTSSIQSKPFQKVLFSATLSSDPEKLKFISLFQPVLFIASNDSQSSINDCSKIDSSQNDVTKKYVIPIELKEFMLISKSDRKPLMLWYLLDVLKYRKVLCFTGSVENTRRLYLLLKNISDVVVAEFSSKLRSKKREKLLNKFIQGKIDIIVCSDIFARGLDIEGINCVICYDPPSNETAYIHRIGRTARAGNAGTAITLLSPEQLGHFNIISRRAHERNSSKNKNSIQRMMIKATQLKPLQSKYEEALKSLSQKVKSDKNKEKLLQRLAVKKSTHSKEKTKQNEKN